MRFPDFFAAVAKINPSEMIKSCLTLSVQTPQNGQPQSNNSSAVANELLNVPDYFVGLALKVLKCLLGINLIIRYINPFMSHFYTPWKLQKTKGFLTFSGGIEMEHWSKMG